MSYVIAFLEGMITFISPCLLPMLPVYVSYFAGGMQRDIKGTLKNALGFIAGFTTVFVLLGALAGTVGQILNEFKTLVNLITGVIVIFFGLCYLGFFKLSIFRGIRFSKTEQLGFFSAFLFGMVFSVGWTPCVGVFLGSALMLAASEGAFLTGVMMLLLYSLGLGIPFLISAILIDQLKGVFQSIKRHYRGIQIVCGSLLVLVGLLMALGLFDRFLNLLS
ncbi:MAG: cytochrome c biogenesis protein CcdA [Lachnospiraceae bacterium]|jgi:cytochrome c-type biogenesis protein|nr:cytochrome c biogenesis protein CcdA [Lachnospiraceae bacterium]